MTTIDDPRAAAAHYAMLGIKVFPLHSVQNGLCSCGCADPECRTRGKHPRFSGWQDRATTSVATINQWWTMWPDANVAAPMDRNGLIGIDIDPRSGGDESWLDITVSDGPFPDTWYAQTGGGGWHYIFAVPDGFTSRTDELGKGIDVKYHGYLVLPPSGHASGRRYEWDVALAPEMGSKPALLPESLLTRIQQPRVRTDAATGSKTSIASLLGERCEMGARHRTLAAIAGWMRGMDMEVGAAEALLQTWNTMHCDPPEEPGEVRNQLFDVYHRYAPRQDVPVELGEAPASEERRFPLVDFTQFKRRRPPRWLIDGIILEDSFCAIVGAPGHGKTLLALEMACCLATGTPFFGRRTMRGRVLYIASEGQGGFAMRGMAWELARGIDLSPGELTVLPGAVNLTDHALVRMLLKQVAVESAGTKYVFIDTLNRNMGGEDENASQPMGRVLAAAATIQKAFGATVFVVHHGRKSDGVIRGHGSLAGAVDTILGVTKAADTKVITVEAIKQKDGNGLDDMRFQLQEVDLTGVLVEEGGEAMEDDLFMPSLTSSVVLDPLPEEGEVAGTEPWLQPKRMKNTRRARALTKYGESVGRVLIDAFGDAGTTVSTLRLTWRERVGEHATRFTEGFNSLISHSYITLEDRYGAAWVRPAPRLTEYFQQHG